MRNNPNFKRTLNIAALTVFFVGAYFVLRALPDAQCGFLHYEEVVLPDGTIEFCATNHAGFLDLSRFTYPVDMRVIVDGKIGADAVAVPGQSTQIALELKTPGGRPIAPHDLAVTHTERMHVMLVDPSLEDYHHVHPQPDGLRGRYLFQFTPKKPGSYQVYTEIVPLRTRRQVVATGKIEVTGEAAEQKFFKDKTSLVDGVKFELVEVPARLRTRADNLLTVSVRAEDGTSVELEDIMGAKGHLVAFDAARKGFAHMHPVDDVIVARAGLGRSSPAENHLSFYFNVPNPGWYRVFAQVQVDGREVFGRFDLHVE